MDDLEESNYLRIENAVLTFIRNHPGLGRKEIRDGVPCFNPKLIDIVLFVLEEKRLIKGQYDHISDESVHRRFDPIVSQH
jgi:hypothetical protein